MDEVFGICDGDDDRGGDQAKEQTLGDGGSGKAGCEHFDRPWLTYQHWHASELWASAMRERPTSCSTSRVVARLPSSVSGISDAGPSESWLISEGAYCQTAATSSRCHMISPFRAGPAGREDWPILLRGTGTTGYSVPDVFTEGNSQLIRASS